MAAVDYFLKIDGIPGESKDDKHKDEIDIESFSWGATNAGDAAGRGGLGSGKASFQDFHFVMRVNKATPNLMLSCAKGDHIKAALLTCRKAGGKQEEYMTVKFTDLLVSAYQTGGSHSDVIPVDQISLNFSKIELEYKEQKLDGSVGGSIKKWYDLKANKGG